MDSTIVDLAHHFDSKLMNLNTAFDLNNAKDDPSCQKILKSLQMELESLECILALMKSEVQKGKKSLSSVEEMKFLYKDIIDDLQYDLCHLPSRLPGQNISDDNAKPTKSNGVSSSSVNQKTVPKEKPVKKLFYCPSIDYLTVDEFETAPKYMKGRLTYNQVNSVVDDLNKAFVSKYKILKMKKSTMSDVNRKKYDTYKMQESKDTSGLYFIVESDIKEFTSMKMDASSRAILTILRHCARLKEVRGGGVTRYVMLESY